MEFLRSFLRRYFAGKPMVASPISRARKTVLRHDGMRGSNAAFERA